jgi:hypothetical protein
MYDENKADKAKLVRPLEALLPIYKASYNAAPLFGMLISGIEGRSRSTRTRCFALLMPSSRSMTTPRHASTSNGCCRMKQKFSMLTSPMMI